MVILKTQTLRESRQGVKDFKSIRQNPHISTAPEIASKTHPRHPLLGEQIATSAPLFAAGRVIPHIWPGI
jgi:hypothetical protein